MIRYVCGFLFSPDGDEVALVEKRKPAWQAGRHNGIGGKIEENETPYDAMVREFREETGADILDWEEFTTIRSENFEVSFFRAFSPDIVLVKTMEEEPIVRIRVRDIDTISIIPNLAYLIPMALDRGIVNSTITIKL